MDLEIAVHDIPAVKDIGGPPSIEGLRAWVGNVGVGVVATDGDRQALRVLARLQAIDPNPVLVVGPVRVCSSARLAVVFDLDTEGHHLALVSAVVGAVFPSAREAGEVGRSLAGLGSANPIARIAERSVEGRQHGTIGRIALAAAGEAVEVCRFEASLLLLPLMHPVALDVVEGIETANAAAGCTYLTAAGGLGGLELPG